MRKIYPILSLSLAIFLVILCVDILLTGLFVGLPENKIIFFLIWLTVVFVALFLLTMFCVYSTLNSLVLFLIFVSVFAIRVFQKNNDFACNYENLPKKGEVYGYAISYPQLIGELKSDESNFQFLLRVTKMRNGSVFVPVKPFVLQVNCRNVTGNEVFCWGTYRVAGRLRLNKSIYYMNKNCIGRMNAHSVVQIDKYMHPMLKVGIARAKLLNKIKNSLSLQSAAFVTAVFFGNRSYIEPEMMKSWQDSGLTHLLAVSGFHVGVLAMLVQFCLRRFFSRTFSSAVTLIVLTIFGLFLNISASSLRAIVMYFVLVINNEMGISCGKLHSLSVAGIILLFINPYSVYDYGFILSFCAVAGILLFANKIVPEKDCMPLFLYNIISGSAVCVAAFGTTALFQCAWFGQLPIFSVITSPFVCLIFSYVFIVLLVCILLAVIFPNATICCVIIEWVSGKFLDIVRILEKVPPIKIENVPLYMGFIMFLGLFLSFYIVQPVYSIVKRKIALKKIKS